jgi:hypothetical protein
MLELVEITPSTSIPGHMTCKWNKTMIRWKWSCCVLMLQVSFVFIIQICLKEVDSKGSDDGV